MNKDVRHFKMSVTTQPMRQRHIPGDHYPKFCVSQNIWSFQGIVRISNASLHNCTC